MDRVYELFPVLGERRKNKAGLFSGGEQQMLAIGRAMMSQPKLLMLDEPSMGLSPIMTQKIFDTVKELKEQGTTVLLVEQNALSALALSDYAYVIDLGATTLSGTGRELLADPRVQEAYLGEGVAQLARLAAAEDRRAGEELPAQPGPLAPHPRRAPPATPARPGRRAPKPGGDERRAPGRRACGGARRRWRRRASSTST